MKKLGLGIQELSEFKERNLIYVDKTEIINKLITTGKYYFLSRPRRFGKSLLVNTLEEIYSGNKELFKDTWIYNNWNFEKNNPVIKISFTKVDYVELGLKKAIDEYVLKLANKFNISLNSSTYSGKFLELIEKLGKDKQVVILIDEYDKPIIDFLEKDELKIAEENRKILKNFYSGIKDMDGFVKFFFVTGVSKFSQVSIFSDLNHLEDITIDENFSTIAGYTKKEILSFYKSYINNLKTKYQIEENELLDKIKEWYNGYSWDGINFVYNPFSIINLFKKNDFGNYWFETGTPSFLVKKIKETKNSFSDIDKPKINKSSFNKFDIDNVNATAIMFQTGYLTIKEYDREKNKYLLDFPNKEVKDSFLNFAISSYSKKNQDETDTIVDNIIEYLENNDIESFITEFKALFAGIAVKELEKVRQYEGYYHSIIFIVLKIIGTYINCEVQSSKGITDAVIKTDKYIFVVEFKMGDAEIAIEQIKAKKYYEPYIADKRQVILLGIGFDKEERNIKNYISKTLEELKNNI